VNFSFSFSVPPGATFDFMAAYTNTSGTAVIESHTQADTLTAITQGQGVLGGVLIDGMLLMGSTPGSLSLLWAQSSFVSSQLNVDQNSYIMAWRLG